MNKGGVHADRNMGIGGDAAGRDQAKGGAASGSRATGGAAQVTVNVKDDDKLSTQDLTGAVIALRDIINEQARCSDESIKALEAQTSTLAEVTRLNATIYGNGHSGLVAKQRRDRELIIGILVFLVISALLTIIAYQGIILTVGQYH